jgi:ATP-dependent DNA helicase RecG
MIYEFGTEQINQKLCEKEESGYDLIYEKLTLDGKLYPKIENDINFVKVTIYSNIMNHDILQIIDYLAKHYQLNQKEIIALGAIVRNKKISGFDLSKLLQLGDDRLRQWVDNLLNQSIIVTEGKTKGLMYMLNPIILSSIEHDLKPSLKTMEEPQLRALIKEDLKLHQNSKISEIHKRMGDFDLNYLRRVIYKMYDEGEINRSGEKKNMVYFIGK